MSLWLLLTQLGNATLVWPTVVLAAGLIVLRDRGQARAALCWVLAFALACGLVAASKVAFYAWGTGVREWNLTCFSGHTVLAMGSWPVLAPLLVSRRWPRARLGMALAGVLLAGLVGYSRVVVGAHPPSEVWAGLLPGAIVAVIGLRALRQVAIPRWGAPLALVAVALLFVASNGRRFFHLPTEHWFQQVATALSGRERACEREPWLRAEAGNPAACIRP